MTDAHDLAPPHYKLGAMGVGADVLQLALSGDWRQQAKRPRATEVYDRIAGHARAKKVVIDAASLSSWDSGLLTFLINSFAHGASEAAFCADASTVTGSLVTE